MTDTNQRAASAAEVEAAYKELVELLKPQLENYLGQRYGITPGSANFQCLNPDHADNRPSMNYDRKNQQVHCFSCGAKYDILDLVGIDNGLSTFKDKVQAAADFAGIDAKAWIRNKLNGGRTMTPKPAEQEHKAAADIDFTERVNAAHKALISLPADHEAIKYLLGRGMTSAEIKAGNIGYWEKGINNLVSPLGVKCGTSDYTIVLPFKTAAGKYGYVQGETLNRDKVINGEQINRYTLPNKKVTGIAAELEKPLYNEYYLTPGNAPEVLFITEGIYDALSVEAAGGAAIALCGPAVSRFKNLVRQNGIKETVFVLGVDNDGPGNKYREKLIAALDELELPYIDRPPAEGKDYNEALQADKGGFFDFVKKAAQDARDHRDEELKKQIAEYYSRSGANRLDGFFSWIEEHKKEEYFPTGFRNIDRILDGGLYAGLYTVGAISSLGKTTLVLQIANNVAKAGHDVLFFSLEMDSKELIAKSISCETYTLKHDKALAKTTRGILHGANYAGYNDEEKALIKQAGELYREYGQHIFIHEGVGDIGVDMIRDQVRQHILFTGNKPLVVIDYLQILAPVDIRATDKQNTDKAVLELKRISRDYNIPILAISSFNRENYNEPVSTASFKESGAIEYTSDILIGFQYTGWDRQKYRDKETGLMKLETDGPRKARLNELREQNKKKAANKEPVRIDCKILKNRNGCKDETCVLDFIAAFNHAAATLGIDFENAEEIIPVGNFEVTQDLIPFK